MNQHRLAVVEAELADAEAVLEQLDALIGWAAVSAPLLGERSKLRARREELLDERCSLLAGQLEEYLVMDAALFGAGDPIDYLEGR